MLKGHVFNMQLFANPIFALFINTFLNGNNGISDNYGQGMALTYSGANITIASGAACIQGRFVEEDTSSTINAGTESAYCKLVIEIDLDKTNTASDFEQGYYKVVKSASAYPSLTQNNIVKNNSGVYQYELARFQTTSTGITNFSDQRTFLDFDSIYDEIEQHIQDIDSGALYVQKSGDIMTGKLYANGGIEGDVQGNVTGNAGSATKLQTARTIGLTGAVSGSGSFNGTGNLTITTTQSNITTITDTLQGSGSSIISKQINYPSGYNQNNCVVLGYLFKNSSQSNWMTGSTFNSGNTFGSMPLRIQLNSGNITVEGRNIILNADSVTLSDISNSTSFNIKIVLMKIS